MPDFADGSGLTVEQAGDTLAEAKQAALRRLEPRFPGLTESDVAFEVLDADTDLVRATVNEESWRDTADGDLPEEPADRLREVVRRVVHELGLEATVRIDETEEELRATVEGDDDDFGLLIGKHGQTIDALQHLATRIAQRGDSDRKRVVVDAAGYRERREAALTRSADQAVAEALRDGRPVELEPMRALERKVVHLHLRDRTDIETHSEGDEPDRRLVVTPVAAASS